MISPTDKLLLDIEARLNKSKSVWYMTSDNKPFIPNDIWYKDAADMNKLIEIVKVLRNVVERNTHPHIDAFCKDRCNKALTKSDEIAGE